MRNPYSTLLSKEVSLQECRSTPVSLPLTLLFEENFHVKVSLTARVQTQVVNFEVTISTFEFGKPTINDSFGHDALSIHITNIANSIFWIRTFIKNIKEKLSKMLIFFNLTFHFNDLEINLRSITTKNSGRTKYPLSNELKHYAKNI